MFLSCLLPFLSFSSVQEVGRQGIHLIRNMSLWQLATELVPEFGWLHGSPGEQHFVRTCFRIAVMLFLAVPLLALVAGRSRTRFRRAGGLLATSLFGLGLLASGVVVFVLANTEMADPGDPGALDLGVGFYLYLSASIALLVTAIRAFGETDTPPRFRQQT